MNNIPFWLYLLTMAGITYLIRLMPLVLIKRKIRNKYILSFLYYIPYTVLSAMTIPAIFFSTSYTISAAVGFAAATIMALMKKGLLSVASVSCASVLITELVINMI